MGQMREKCFASANFFGRIQGLTGAHVSPMLLRAQGIQHDHLHPQIIDGNYASARVTWSYAATPRR